MQGARQQYNIQWIVIRNIVYKGETKMIDKIFANWDDKHLAIVIIGGIGMGCLFMSPVPLTVITGVITAIAALATGK